ncbi:UNVERIFIED_CONTAM: U-box domain-containing protein 38 [Sesamum calycinum]|uniref:RING-type E3 ubiquitin transferase n=1 Tax=Sesamum calycinum TaxID=2727403 RepID=A0AAW2JC09_9LAMI
MQMGRTGKLRRWRISFSRSSSTASTAAAAVNKKEPPKEFICPISNSLMFDPAVVSSGQTFERVAVHVCRDLGFTPTLPDGSTPDFSTLIPNLALKTAIVNWCSKSGLERPSPPVYSDIESIVRSLSGSATSEKQESSRNRALESELLKGVAERPPIFFSRAASELNPRNLYSPASSEESVIANTTPLLPFETRPSCFSHSSSPSTSSEFVFDEASSNYVSASSSISSSEDESFVNKLKSFDVYEQEQAVILLRKTTRTDEEARAALCTERLLFALKQLLNSRYAAVQTNATAALVNLSLEKENKLKIVRAGILPSLIDILMNGFEESREHAAGAIFSLALEDDNKTAIGVLGALQPLLHLLRSGSRRGRHDAALALYHLTLMQQQQNENHKAWSRWDFSGVAERYRVRCLVAAIRNGSELDSESTHENCVAALYSLSHGSSRFNRLAKDARAEDVLRAVVETGSEWAREKARQILVGLRREDEIDEGDEVDWEAVMKGGVTRARSRVGRSRGRNSVEF